MVTLRGNGADGSADAADQDTNPEETADPDVVMEETTDPDAVMEETTDPDAVMEETTDPDVVMEEATDPDAVTEEADAQAAEQETAAEDGAKSDLFETTQMSSTDATGAGDPKGDGYLQNLINQKLAEVTGTLTGKIKLVLESSVIYTGNVTITAGSREIADDFEFEISAADAGEDGMRGDGSTKIDGNVVIRGIKVLMNSVMIDEKKQIEVRDAGSEAGDDKDRGGYLVYKGSAVFPTEVKVVVKKKSSAEIKTSDDDDIITVVAESGAKKVEVDTGDGINTVNATIGGGDATIKTGFGSDTISLNITGTTGDLGKIDVTTGDSYDDVTIINNGTGKGTTINTGAGDDIISLDVRANAGDMTINTGADGDTVTVVKGDHYTPENIDYSRVYNPTEDVTNGSGTIIHFVNGDENAVDRFTVDAAAAGAIKGLDFSGGKGASIHFKGTLNQNISEDKRITWIDPKDKSKGFTLHTSFALGESGDANDFTLDITTQKKAEGSSAPVYNFTDVLKNKKTVELYTSGKDARYYTYDPSKFGNLEDFTDYVFRTPVNKLIHIQVGDNAATGADSPRTLTNLVLDTDQTLDTFEYADSDDEKDKLHLQNVSAHNINVLMRGRSIEIDGDIKAQNVRAEAVQGIATLLEAGTSFLDTITETPTSIVETPAILDGLRDLISIINTSRINVTENGFIVADKDIALLARIKQYGSVSSLLPEWINVINLKVAIASVKVEKGASLNALGGTVSAEAKIETTTGENKTYNEDGTTTDSKYGMPIAVTVVVDNASVEVEEGAVIEAAEDILLKSSSDVKVNNYARSGLMNSPVALGLTVISNHVKTEVNGKLVAGRKALISASGTVSDNTEAYHGATATGASGGFAALNFVDQDVDAIIGSKADVKTSRGDVSIYSTNIADVKTTAKSGNNKEAPGGPLGTSIFNLFTVIMAPIKESLASWMSDTSYTDQIDGMIAKVGAGSYSVKVVNLDAQNSEYGSATVENKVQIKRGIHGDTRQAVVLVKPQPKDGYRVKKVQYRYLEPGRDSYTYVTVEKDDKGRYLFVVDHDDIEVIVTYTDQLPDFGEDEILPDEGNNEDLEDAFNLTGMWEDVNGIFDGGAEEGDDDFLMPKNNNAGGEGGADGAGEQEDAVKKYTLNMGEIGEGGRILTWLTNSSNENLMEAAAGQKLRLVPNPDAGKQLDQLKITYTVTEDGMEVVKSVIISADSAGRYIFSVPEDLPEGTKLYINATFKGEDTTQEVSHKQRTGALAAGVVINNGDSVIKAGSKVEAGREVDMFGFAKTASVNTADGSAIKEGSKEKAADDNKPKPTTITRYSVPGAGYAIRVSSTLSGDVTYTAERSEEDGEWIEASHTHPIITIKPNDQTYDHNNIRVLLSYYTKYNTSYFHGTRTTKEFGADDLTFNPDGTITFKPDLGSYAVVEGTTMEVSFIFSDAEGNVKTSADQSVQKYVVPNTINTSVNALSKKNSNGTSSVTELGQLRFVREEEGKYYFNVYATKDGYTINAAGKTDGNDVKSNTDALYATWTTADGSTKKNSLTYENGYWVFKIKDGNTAIPAGAKVTICAVFTEDTREIKSQQEKDASGRELANGTIKFSKTKAKYTDEIVMTLTGYSGYYGTSVDITYVGADEKKHTETVTVSGTDGKIKYTMPNLAKTATLTVTPHFTKKEIALTVKGTTGADDTSKNSLKLSETSGYGFQGQTISVSPSDDLVKKGYKVASVTIKGKGTSVTIPYNQDKKTFQIPADLAANIKELEISAELKKKDIEIHPYIDVQYGSAEPVCAYVEPGETVVVKIKPTDGYRIKAGTLKASVKTAGGVSQIVLKHTGENQYEFKMTDGDANTLVTLEGEFEPGSDGVESSLGVGIAVGYTKGRNNAEIQGGDVSGESLSMLAVSLGGKAYTTAKAGYNEGDSGTAGAFAVQIADTFTNIAVRKDENGSLTVKDGSIFMLSKAKQNYEVTGDASGEDVAEAKKSGVGAGIAFVVNTIETNGIIEDGVKLGAGTNITGITLNVGHKDKDTVKAKAGAAGGTATVPVAAVDIFNSNVLSKLGKLDLSKAQAAVSAKEADLRTDADKQLLAGYLPVSGKVKIKASSDPAKVWHNHQIEADASARGGNSALGGAFIVTWISNLVDAKLNQSLASSGDIAVASQAGDSVKAVAKAAASGGAEGGKGGKDDSADKKADKLLGGSGKIAARYTDINGGAIQNDVKGRQKAETAESSVAGAGAFILNMQRNKSHATVADGVNLMTRGKLTVTSANRTEGTLKADASATKSDVGVGVGVALNIVTMDNIATIGNGTISAKELEVSATIAKEPTKVRQVKVAENASNFKTQLTTTMVEGLKNLIGDDYKYVDYLLGPETTFVASFVDKLVQDLNLQQLMNICADGAGGSFANAGEMLLKRLESFPVALVEPMRVVLEEACGSLDGWSDERFENLISDVWHEAIVQLFGNGADVLRSTIKKEANSLLGSTLDMVTAKLSGKGWDGSKLKEDLYAAGAEAFEEVLARTADRVIQTLGESFPIITDNNAALVERLKQTSAAELKKSLIPYVLKTFRETVYDYEPLLVQVEQTGFFEYLKKEIRAALKEATANMTNEMIDKIVGKLDVAFERESIADRHVITTQAISGAGAKTKSGAGSLAIAVANLDTRASIGGGDGAVSVTGNTTLKAEELRRIRTHATAAVDADGEADNNEGVGDGDDEETGGTAAAKSTKSKQFVTFSYGIGGWADIEDPGMDSELNPVFKTNLVPMAGYKIEEGTELVRTYTDPEGNEKQDTITVKKDEDGNAYVDAVENIDWDAYDEEQVKKVTVHVEVEFEEDPRDLKDPQIVSDSLDTVFEYTENGGDLRLYVEGKEQTSGKAVAKTGDFVEIVVDKVNGIEVGDISVYDTDGNVICTYPPFLDPDENTPKPIRQTSSNANEEVYIFLMPEEEIGDIKVSFKGRYEDDGTGNTGKKSKTEAKDKAGRSIGVGAAFAFTYGGSDVTAEIGKRAAGVVAGTLAVKASSDHEEENYSTAGTDPFEGTSDDEKDMGVDASLAINILDNNIYAGIAKGTKVTTTAQPPAVEEPEEEKEESQAFDVAPADGGQEEEETEEDAPEDIEATSGSLVVTATENAWNETKASAFATGSTTAVGASVAVNVSLSDIKAEMGADANVAGKAVVLTHTLSQDNTWSFASAMGADIQRNLNKFADKVESVEDGANSLTTGSIFDEKAKDKKEKEKSNDTSKRITNRLNNDKVKNQGGDDASENLSVSTNVLRSMGVKQESGDDADNAGKGVNDLVSQKSGKDVNSQENQNKEKRLQVAATIGVTVALHEAAVKVDGSIQAGREVSLTSRNAGNFNTRATAAAMTLEDLSKEGTTGKTIAAAVGVSVNNNKATVDVTKDIVARAGDVDVIADLSQNMSGDYRGKLAVQSIAGSVSGKGTSHSVAGAISVVVSHATTRAKVDGAKKIASDYLYTDEGEKVGGGNVTVKAYDKSKLAIRAGGINVSKGANVGAGISAATIWSGNTVEAKVGDGTTVNADTFNLIAEKAAVSFADYKFPLGMQDLISDSSQLDDEERENVYTGIIDVHRKPGEKSYTVDINMDTYALMKVADALNILSSNNYYVESVAGSLVTGRADDSKPNKLNGAGSISIVRAKNTVKAILGDQVKIEKITKDGEESTAGKAAEVNIEAIGDTNARLLGGSVAGGKAKNSVGVTLTFLSSNDEVETRVGSDLDAQAEAFRQTASADMNIQTFNVAASANTDEEAKKTLGGALNGLLLENSAKNVTGSGAKITAGTVDVLSGAEMDLILVSVSAAGAKKGTAAGGTLAFVDDRATADVEIGADHTITADKDVMILARAEDRVINVLASASGAGEGSGAAGAINLMHSATKGKVALGSGGEGHGITSNTGSVAVRGETDTRVINITAAAAGAKGKAVGMSVNANMFERESGVHIAGGDGYVIKAAKDVQTTAGGNDLTIMGALAVAGSGKGEEADNDAMAGNLPIIWSNNTVSTAVDKGSIIAGGEAAIASHLTDRTYAVAGSLAVSTGSDQGDAMGATAMFIVKDNTVTTDLGTTGVEAAGRSGELAKKLNEQWGKKTVPSFRGIYTGASVDDTIIAGAAGVSYGEGKGITGNLVWLDNTNTVTTDASKAVLKAASYWNEADREAGIPASGGDVTVEAKNDSSAVVLAGGVSAAESTAVGASIVVIDAEKEVTAKAGDMQAYGDVNVRADNKDVIFELALSAGGSKEDAFEVGVALQGLKSRVNAVANGDVKTKTGSLGVYGLNNTTLINSAVALAGSGENAVTPVFAVSSFLGETNAVLGSGSIDARNGVIVYANSDKDLDQFTIGAAYGGEGALSGAISVMRLKDATSSVVGEDVDLTARTLDVVSESDYKLIGASAAVGASKEKAAAINGMLTIAKGSTIAQMDGTASLSGKANVKAASDRDIIDVAASVAASGENALGVTVMGLVAGDRLSQDAADMITYGNVNEKPKASDKKTFDTGRMLSYLKDAGVDTSDLEDRKDKDGNVVQTSLEDDLTGSGTYEKDASVGENGTFDASSKMVDKSLYEGDEGSKGENAKMDQDSADVASAKEIGKAVHVAATPDIVQAKIGQSANITAAGADVLANQETKADVFGGTVAVGGEAAGAGVSFAAALLRSNVFASSNGTLNLKGEGVHVQAVSSSGYVEAEDGSEEAQRNAAIGGELKDSDAVMGEILGRSIRTIGLAVGVGGQSGLGVAGAVVRTDNITDATLGGKVTNAGSVDVEAKSEYDKVLAATLGIAGGGEFAAAGSVAVAMASGDVEAKLDETTRLSGEDTAVKVHTYSNVEADAVAVTAAVGGGLSAAAGAAVASNHLNQTTSVDNGAVLDISGGNGTLSVTGTSDTRANAGLLGVSLGEVAVGLGVAASVVKPKVETTVGVHGDGTVSLGRLSSVDVSNNVSSDADAGVLSVTGGAAAVSGNVLLVFNDTKADAVVANADGSLGSLNIQGDLDASGDSVLGAATVGSIAVGVSTSYVDVHSINNAKLLTDNFTATVDGDLTVSAGEDPTKTTKATATTVAGAAGAAAVGVNIAVARNRAENNALISGTQGVKADTVNLKAQSDGSTDASLYGLSIGSVSVAGSANVALNESTSRAIMDIDGPLEGDLNVSSKAVGDTDSSMYTGSGALYGVKVNVGAAYGRTNSIIDVDIAKASDKKISINAVNTGNDDVSASIDNQSFEAFSAAAMVGVAYSQDVYDTKVKLGGGDYDLSNVNVSTDYDTTVTSTVTPSASGVDGGLVKVAANIAVAKGSAYAGSSLELADASASVDGDISVVTDGETRTDADVKTAKLTATALSIGANVSYSDVSAVQAASLVLNKGSVKEAENVKVESTSRSAAAYANVGSAGITEEQKEEAGDDLNIALIGAKVNSATAKENLDSTAAILGSGSEDNSIEASSVTVNTSMAKGKVYVNDSSDPEDKTWTDNYSLARAESNSGVNVGLLTMGGLLANTVSSDSFHSVVDGVNVDVTGKADITSNTNTKAVSVGEAPGELSAVSVSVTDMRAKVGKSGDAQTSKVIIGDDTVIHSGDDLKLEAKNTGYAATDMHKGGSYSAANISSSSLPTDSYYDTGVIIGKNSDISTDAQADLTSDVNARAKSTIDAKSIGVLFNSDKMKGTNTIMDENNIDIGAGTTITTEDDLNVKAESSAQANAASTYKGGGVFSGNSASSENNVTRNVRINVGEGAAIESMEGAINMQSISGAADKITTTAEVKSGGGYVLSRAFATSDIRSNNEINFAEDVNVEADGDINLLSRATSHQAGGTERGVYTYAKTDTGAFVADPESVADTKLNLKTFVNVNKGTDHQKTQLKSNKSDVNIQVDNDALKVESNSGSDTRGGGGSSDATSTITANLGNTIWIDDANLYARKNVNLIARNAGEGHKPSLKADALAELYAAQEFIGIENGTPMAEIKGQVYNQIRSFNTRKVTTKGNFNHAAYDPKSEVSRTLIAYSDGIFGKTHEKDNEVSNTDSWKHRCDFCEVGDGLDAEVTERRPHVDQESIDLAKVGNADDARWGSASGIMTQAMDESLRKALSPLNDIQRMVQNVKGITKARYGEEDLKKAGEIFTLDLEVLLGRDVRLDDGALARYYMWKNAPTQMDVYLLPNADRLFTTGGGKVQYVSEVVEGDILGNGQDYKLDIISAITDYAFANPLFPIGSTGSLDLKEGIFTLPDSADYELYLHEISGEWLLEKYQEGFLQTLIADQDKINEAALEGKELPEGEIVTVLTEGGQFTTGSEETKDLQTWRQFWIGDTPQSAKDDEQTLICLLRSEQTDEVDAYRTTRGRMQRGEDPVDVSLYLYRDSRSDHRGEERYNVMYFDTPDDQKSLVKVVTDVLMDRELEMPRPLKIVLRRFWLDGADLPAYSINDHFFVLNDITDGIVAMFEDFYLASFDGETFDSGYAAIDGISKDDPQVLIKSGQPIWPEWTGEIEATDIAGTDYVYVSAEERWRLREDLSEEVLRELFGEEPEEELTGDDTPGDAA